MGALDNLTPFQSAVYSHVDGDGKTGQLVVVKAVFALNTNRLVDDRGPFALRPMPLMQRMGQLRLEPCQREVLGNRLEESIEWLPSDNVPPKPWFDLLVCGYAHSPEGLPRESFGASVSWNARQIGLRLHAPRRWQRTLIAGGGAVPGDYRAPVVTVPVHPAFAYGGGGDSNDLYNPLGMGQPRQGVSPHLTPLPWVEHESHAVLALQRRPKPGAFGPWPENAEHRREHMGTWDEAWKLQRAPRSPKNFSARFYNLADPRLQTREPPGAGALISLRNLSPRGVDHIIWPPVQPLLHIDRQPAHAMRPDTCLVDGDAGLYAIVWRSVAPARAALTLRAA